MGIPKHKIVWGQILYRDCSMQKTIAAAEAVAANQYGGVMTWSINSDTYQRSNEQEWTNNYCPTQFIKLNLCPKRQCNPGYRKLKPLLLRFYMLYDSWRQWFLFIIFFSLQFTNYSNSKIIIVLIEPGWGMHRVPNRTSRWFLHQHCQLYP